MQKRRIWNYEKRNKKTIVEFKDVVRTYGEGEAQKFDLYLPADRSKTTYGLVVYLHAGGFTSGDKKDDHF